MKLIEVDGNDKEIIRKIIEIEEEAFGKSGGVDEWILKPLVRYGKVFVLENENKNEIVSVSEYMQKYDSKEMFLYGLCTKKKYRGKKYAETLLKKTEKYFFDKGIEKLSLTVDPENEKAIKLYKKIGYEEVELLKDEYGENIERIYMVKEKKKKAIK